MKMNSLQILDQKPEDDYKRMNKYISSRQRSETAGTPMHLKAAEAKAALLRQNLIAGQVSYSSKKNSQTIEVGNDEKDILTSIIPISVQRKEIQKRFLKSLAAREPSQNSG